jgi:hypothetical protein
MKDYSRVIKQQSLLFNINVDITASAPEAFLEPSSGTLERLESQII